MRLIGRQIQELTHYSSSPPPKKNLYGAINLSVIDCSTSVDVKHHVYLLHLFCFVNLTDEAIYILPRLSS